MVNTLVPFGTELSTLRQAMDRLLDDAFVGAPFRTLWSRTGSPVQGMPLDVYATEDEVVVLAAVPGMRPEDLEVTAHQNTITLSGTVGDPAESEEAKGATWYLHELWSGQYRRSLTLPVAVDADKARATFEHGVVRIVLPKAEQAKPRKIAIQGGNAQAIGAGSQAGTGA
jgi:HSP20 family protein